MGDIIDIMQGVFDRMKEAYGGSLYFLYGHRMEIANILVEKTQSKTLKYQKYPLVCLFTDIPEAHIDGHTMTVSLNMIVCTDTDSSYSTMQRKQINFDTLLHPLADMLIQQITLEPSMRELHPAYTKTDRYKYGTEGISGNDSNIFDDFIDAVEFEGLTMIIDTNFYKCD